jgi:hypothetical protein
MMVRAPQADDWNRILDVANASVGDVPNAGLQDKWLGNRRDFDGGVQDHFVVTEDGSVVGYGAIENAPDAPPDAYRVFIVAAPTTLARIGDEMYGRAAGLLARRRAAASWFVEYAADARFVTFIQSWGYTETRRFVHDGRQLVVMSKQHTDESIQT